MTIGNLARRIGRHPLTWIALAALLYRLAAGEMWDQQSLAPHYVLLAEAFLHGRLDLPAESGLYDLLVTERGSFVAGSPLPAVLLMPFVWRFGAEFSDVLFSIGLAALAVGAAQWVFGRIWLTVLFALGTPLLIFAALGSYWFQAHLAATLFALLALGSAQRGRWGLAGGALALAALARPTVLCAAPGLALLLWQQADGRRSGWAFWRTGALFVAPLAAAVALHTAYNAARFGAPGDFGYGYVQGAPNITAAYAQYGGFHPHFLGCNLFVSLINPPEINGYVPPALYRLCDHLLAGVDLATRERPLLPNPLGMSVFIATPALLLLFGAGWRRPTARVAWVGLLGVMVPLWLYHNTGSAQFGYRYAMDAAPFWLWLLHLAAPPDAPPGRLWAARLLTAASVLTTLWGWWWLYRLFVGQTWWELWRIGR